MSTDEVKLRVLHGSVGGITESDILLAAASNAIVIGFNVRPESKGAALAAKEGVDVRLYTIIYEAVADVRAAMEGMLEPTYREQTQGRVEIRQTFNISRRRHRRRLLRHRRQSSARELGPSVARSSGGPRRQTGQPERFKDDVRDVAAGYECGLSLEGYQDFKQGDVIESYQKIPVIRRINPTPSGREARV